LIVTIPENVQTPAELRKPVATKSKEFQLNVLETPSNSRPGRNLIYEPPSYGLYAPL
jgi:hypothetical protein